MSGSLSPPYTPRGAMCQGRVCVPTCAERALRVRAPWQTLGLIGPRHRRGAACIALPSGHASRVLPFHFFFTFAVLRSESLLRRMIVLVLIRGIVFQHER